MQAPGMHLYCFCGRQSAQARGCAGFVWCVGHCAHSCALSVCACCRWRICLLHRQFVTAAATATKAKSGWHHQQWRKELPGQLIALAVALQIASAGRATALHKPVLGFVAIEDVFGAQSARVTSYLLLCCGSGAPPTPRMV